MRERLREKWSSDVSKPRKSAKYTNETVAGAAGAPRKTKDPKELAEEWRTKIRQDKTRLEQGKKVLAETIIPYFKEVQHEIASKDFSFAFHS
jgi:hypothetical protein